MLVIFHNLVVNINSVHAFWTSDYFEDSETDKYYIKFTDSTSKIRDSDVNFFAFDLQEKRDEAFKNILFAYAEGKKVFAIIDNSDEKKDE